MTSPKDDGRKDPPRQGDPKRPHATLDLKAVEIKAAEQKASDAKPGDAKPADVKSVDVKSTEAKPADAKPTDTTTSSVKPGAAASSSVPPSGATAAGAAKAAEKPSDKPTEKPAAGKPASPPPASPPTAASVAPSRGGGSAIGRLLSHTTAGLVGGFIALLGADAIAPHLRQLGLPIGVSSTAPDTVELKSRLDALEKLQQSAATAADADLAEKVASATARLAKLEGLSAEVATLTDAQAKLQAEAAALAGKVGTGDARAAGASAERVAKLEEQLQLLSKAAEGSQGAAAIPQLAAVTGRVADLQSTVANQLASLRKSVSEEIDTRVSRIAEAAEAAVSGTQRVDRELSDVKTENARMTQRMESLKSESTRLADTIRIVQEETAKTATAIDALKGDVNARLKTFAKPDDVANAIQPVTEKIGKLEKSVESVVTAEDNRKANAERIVLSLELANLKRVIDRGLGYSDELAQVKKAAAGKIDLAALDKYKMDGVPTLTELQKAFQPLSHDIIDAATQPQSGSVVDRLLSGAKSVVRVRKTSHAADDDSVEAVVARMDKALDEGRISDFMSLRAKLPAAALAPAASFMPKIEARHAVDKALGEIEAQLKSSLGSTASAAPAAPATR